MYAEQKWAEYRLLAIQNYLRAIARASGVQQPPQNDSFMQSLSEEQKTQERHGEHNIKIEDEERVMWSVGPSTSLEDEVEGSTSPPPASTQLLFMKNCDPSASLPVIRTSPNLTHPEDDPLHQSLDLRKKFSSTHSTGSKISLMKKLSRILHSNDRKSGSQSGSIADEEKGQSIALLSVDTASSLNGANPIIRRIRTASARGERAVLLHMPSLHPVVVTCSMRSVRRRPPDDKRRRHHGTPKHTLHQEDIDKRLDHFHRLFGYEGDLHAVSIRDDEEISYGRMLKLKEMRKHTHSMSEKKLTYGRSHDRLDSAHSHLDLQQLHREAGDADDLLTVARQSGADYSPHAISEIECTLNTTVRGTAFVSSVRHYHTPAERKRLLNDRFHLKYPDLRITYSKLRSIKREMRKIGLFCEMHLIAIAHAYVYYERCVLQNHVGKLNRKEVAAACLVIACKICDAAEGQVLRLVEKCSSAFRISTTAVLSLELPVCLILSFELMPAKHHIMPHFLRLQVERSL